MIIHVFEDFAFSILGFCLACWSVDLSALRRTRISARESLVEAASMLRNGSDVGTIVRFLEDAERASQL